MSSHVAVAFGEDGTEGDSAFDWGCSVPCSGQETFEQLQKKWLSKHVDSLEMDEDELIADMAIEGFWVIETERYSCLEDVMFYADPWSDSSGYAFNNQAKSWLDANSTKVFPESST